MATKSTKAYGAKKTVKSGKKTTKSAEAKKKPPAMTLGEWFGTLAKNAGAAVAAGNLAVGACLVSDPHTGTEACVLADEKTCKNLKGTFLGGPCPN
jgi:hypothetical protein